MESKGPLFFRGSLGLPVGSMFLTFYFSKKRWVSKGRYAEVTHENSQRGGPVAGIWKASFLDATQWSEISKLLPNW